MGGKRLAWFLQNRYVRCRPAWVGGEARMCAIAGILNLTEGVAPSESSLRAMLGMVRHRGPDQFGIFLEDQVALGNARLSIVDVSGGQQPIGSEDENLWIVFNGEVFNHLELRSELEQRGHRFTTHCDTEVVLHLYEEHGPECLRRLNGQFALAIWNRHERSLFLARDRVGVRPLFYTCTPDRLLFASEIKAILADPRIDAQIDPVVSSPWNSFGSSIGSAMWSEYFLTMLRRRQPSANSSSPFFRCRTMRVPRSALSMVATSNSPSPCEDQ